MSLDYRHFLRSACLLLLGCISSTLLLSARATAQPRSPDKPIYIIVGFAAGGPADFAARVIGDELSKAVGQAIVIENATGAGGNIATDRVVTAAPDGYTLLMATSGMIV